MKYKFLILAGICFSAFQAISQNFEQTLSKGQIRGNFQFDMQYYQEDTLIGAEQPKEQVLSNGFLNLIYTNGNFSTGFRYESYQNALLGFPTGYEGAGITYRYASYTKDKLSVTAGNFYEQFGNGLALRAYEERGLGYDNALDGIRVKYEVVKGINVTGLTGKQRLFFDYGEGIVRGFDAEISVNEVAPQLNLGKTRVSFGGSAVSKFQPDEDSRYNLPENVATVAGRFNVNRGKINVNAEYAYKSNDPSSDNAFIFKDGNALFLQTSYSQKGLGIVLSAKRNDNMSFRSDRVEGTQNLLINYLPALTKQHTYNLLATLYPYATQLNGEVAFQADVIYKVKKKTLFGGKYGMDILLNYATANNIDTTNLNDENTLRQGYKSKFFSVGEVYFKDFNVQVNKKFSKKLKGRFTYANQVFNIDIIQGKPGEPKVYSDIYIADITYKFTSRKSLRTELQFLSTEQDKGDWATVLFEFSKSPHWFVAIQNQYNLGGDKKDDEVNLFKDFDFKSAYNYYNISAGYTSGGNRISMSYGRQRAGIFCVGGVCRVVPASNGAYISITSSF
jgi:hypothetical protein